jgi:hypothetical protein
MIIFQPTTLQLSTTHTVLFRYSQGNTFCYQVSWLSDVLGHCTFDSWPGDWSFPGLCSFLWSLLVNARLVPWTGPQQFPKSVEDQVMQRIILPFFCKYVKPGGKLLNYNYDWKFILWSSVFNIMYSRMVFSPEDRWSMLIGNVNTHQPGCTVSQLGNQQHG